MIMYPTDKCISGILKSVHGLEFIVKIFIECRDIWVHVPETSEIHGYDVLDAIQLSYDLTESNVGTNNNRLGCVLSYLYGGTYIELELTDNKELIVHAYSELLHFSSQEEARKELTRNLFQSIRVVNNIKQFKKTDRGYI